MVRAPQDAEVVLHHDDGVAAGDQILERRDQAVAIGRVQPGGRLVQHVERVDQPRPEAVGEVDALRLAAAERARETVEGQVPEAHALEEAEAADDLVQDVPGHRRARLGELQGREAPVGLADRHAPDLPEVHAPHAHGERLGAQAAAAAGAAQRVAHVAAGEEPVMGLAHLRAHLLQPGDDARVALVAALEHLPLLRAAELGPAGVQRDGVAGAVAVQGRPFPREALRRPGLDGPFADREVRVRHDPGLVELEAIAEALARGARALRIVEREELRRGFGEDAPAAYCKRSLAANSRTSPVSAWRSTTQPDWPSAREIASAQRDRAADDSLTRSTTTSIRSPARRAPRPRPRPAARPRPAPRPAGSPAPATTRPSRRCRRPPAGNR